MKPGDLVRFRQERVPQYDISQYDGDICIITELMPPGTFGDYWVRVLYKGSIKRFRKSFFEVIDETR